MKNQNQNQNQDPRMKILLIQLDELFENDLACIHSINSYKKDFEFTHKNEIISIYECSYNLFKVTYWRYELLHGINSMKEYVLVEKYDDRFIVKNKVTSYYELHATLKSSNEGFEDDESNNRISDIENL